MQDEAGEFRAITDNLIKYFANNLRKELSIIGEFLFLWYVFLLSTIIHHHNYIEGDMRNWSIWIGKVYRMASDGDFRVVGNRQERAMVTQKEKPQTLDKEEVF